jgi:hypothetical protein
MSRIELRKTIPGSARQASYGVWVDDSVYPWTLKESHQEYHLSQEIGGKGELIEELPYDTTVGTVHNLLIKHEGVRRDGEPLTWERQDAWLRETYSDDYEDETEEDRDFRIRSFNTPIAQET